VWYPGSPSGRSQNQGIEEEQSLREWIKGLGTGSLRRSFAPGLGKRSYLRGLSLWSEGLAPGPSGLGLGGGREGLGHRGHV